jgi:hypothetical protein
MRRFVTILVSSSMLLFSLLPFVKSIEAKQMDPGSVRSTTNLVLNHADHIFNSGGTILSGHESHYSHSSHESHSSHYSSRY